MISTRPEAPVGTALKSTLPGLPTNRSGPRVSLGLRDVTASFLVSVVLCILTPHGDLVRGNAGTQVVRNCGTTARNLPLFVPLIYAWLLRN